LIIILALISFLPSCDGQTFKDERIGIEFSLFGTDLKLLKQDSYDSTFQCNYSEFNFPELYCNVENLKFKPSMRILDKYADTKKIEFKIVSNDIFNVLSKKYEVLSSNMFPFEGSQSLNYVVESNNHKLIFNFYLVKSYNKNILIEYVSTFGTRRVNEPGIIKIIKRLTKHNTKIKRH